MAHLQIGCDVGIFVAGSTGHLGLTEDCALPSIIIFGCGPPSTSTPIPIMIMEKSSLELRGSTSTLPSDDHAVFPNSKLVSAATTSSSIVLTIPLVELCGCKSTTTVQKFRQVPMEESPAIYDIPKPCQI
ncbi:hypothetical protein PSTG_18885 [Puccinia striiformis f. sp. tritici PST-78]|uniref:Uncharacterized protein n=1 Tax=Puccinia striiformis f. sp. tritici PST-78 TaxID=1165861 RepID=A0A0L0UL87_9BASI|nr:hypothetical protein PSTG_18885 [Puccinia striiformis f. sp. tritici PST-78]